MEKPLSQVESVRHDAVLLTGTQRAARDGARATAGRTQKKRTAHRDEGFRSPRAKSSLWAETRRKTRNGSGFFWWPLHRRGAS